MPITVPATLRFAKKGTATALPEAAVDELLGLARKIQSEQGDKTILETFKRHFCHATGETYAPSSNLSWAETDFWRCAEMASADGPNFIAAFCNACEALGERDAIIPTHDHINEVLTSNGSQYHIENGMIISTGVIVASPNLPLDPRDSVSKALSDAVALVGQSGAASGIDRAHTALHGYLIHLCSEARIDVPIDASTTKLFKLLRQKHPALNSEGHRSDDITKILNSLASALDALSPIRNKASLAHPNELLEEPEAMAALNATRTIFRYIQDCLHRYSG